MLVTSLNQATSRHLLSHLLYRGTLLGLGRKTAESQMYLVPEGR